MHQRTARHNEVDEFIYKYFPGQTHALFNDFMQCIRREYH
jgi:hypothetical protein